MALMASSVINLTLFLLVDGTTMSFIFAEVASVLGIISAVRVLIPKCQGGLHPLALMKQIYILGLLSMAMDAFTLLITTTVLVSVAFDCPPGAPNQQLCDTALLGAACFGIILGTHGMLSYKSGRSAHDIVRSLNPVSSGIVSL